MSMAVNSMTDDSYRIAVPNSVQQSLFRSWQFHSKSNFMDLTFQCHVHTISPLIGTLGQINPVRIIWSYRFRTEFNVIVPSMPVSCKWPLCRGFFCSHAVSHILINWHTDGCAVSTPDCITSRWTVLFVQLPTEHTAVVTQKPTSMQDFFL